jgi:pyruvate dehydrogenase E1 component
VRILAMGCPATEALAASDQLLERGIYADVIIVTSPTLLCGRLGRKDDFRHLFSGLGVDGSLHLKPAGGDQAPLATVDAVDLAGRRVPIVSVHDGEAGLLDNIGSLVGVRQIPLAVRKFSKSGTPREVYAYHHIDAPSIVEAAGRVLAETALERTKLSAGAIRLLAEIEQRPAEVENWRELWS